jgi:CubicO group peptidase (beta-lactamase class C family)
MDSSYKIPGGGLVSTAEDLVRFGVALMDGKLLKPETLTQMWTASGKPGLSNGRPTPYGMGFGIVSADGEKIIAHGGSQQGTATSMEFIPGKRFAVAVFINNEDAKPMAVINAVADAYHMPRIRNE